MTEYDIQRWDVVLCNGHRLPMIYITPDVPFLEYAEDNNYKANLTVKDTKTVYDGKHMTGLINQSTYVPNCRPNFYSKTGYYVITLDSSWNGYPQPGNLGKIILV